MVEANPANVSECVSLSVDFWNCPTGGASYLRYGSQVHWRPSSQWRKRHPRYMRVGTFPPWYFMQLSFSTIRSVGKIRLLRDIYTVLGIELVELGMRYLGYYSLAQ